MNMILHIVAKDWTMLRGRLAVWFLVVAAKFAIGIHLVLAARVTVAKLERTQGTVVALIVADVALTLLIAALLVQEDGVAGTPAFWRTRPISRAKLLAAKVIAASGLLVLPAIVAALPWWVVCGFDSAQVGRAALEVALFQGALLALAFAAATVTDSLGRCFVWGLAGIGVLLLLSSLTNQWLRWSVVSPLAQGPVLVVALGAAAAVQYLTGRRRQTVMVLAGGCLATVLSPLGWWWVASGPANGSRLAEVRPELARGVTVEVAAGTAREINYRRRHGWLGVKLRTVGVPERLQAQVAATTLRWQIDGRTIERRGWGGVDLWAAVKVPFTQAPETDQRGAPMQAEFMLEAEDLPRLRSASAGVTADLRIELLRPKEAFTLSLVDRAWRAGDGHGARVLQTEATDRRNEVRAFLMETQPISVLGEWSKALRGPRTGTDEIIYVTHHASRKARVNAQSTPVAGLMLGGVQVRTRKIDIDDLGLGGREGLTGSELLGTVSVTAMGVTREAAINREVKLTAIDFPP